MLKADNQQNLDWSQNFALYNIENQWKAIHKDPEQGLHYLKRHRLYANLINIIHKQSKILPPKKIRKIFMLHCFQ